MTFAKLAQFTDVALLLLRLMVGIVFITSGQNHLRNPEEEVIRLRQGYGVTGE